MAQRLRLPAFLSGTAQAREGGVAAGVLKQADTAGADTRSMTYGTNDRRWGEIKKLRDLPIGWKTREMSKIF